MELDSSTPEEVLQNFIRIRNDPFEFLKCVRTLDPADKVNPVKTFPWELDYVELYVRVWQRKNKIAVPKSRRMKMTWLNLCLFTWDALFHAGRHEAIISKKEEDSDELIKRCHFICENLDPAILPKKYLPRWEYTYLHLKFPELNSLMQAFPSGSDQTRQYTLSRMFFDEMAFWPEAEQAYSGSIPTIEGGGQVVCVSSAAPGFFKQLVYDELDEGMLRVG